MFKQGLIERALSSKCTLILAVPLLQTWHNTKAVRKALYWPSSSHRTSITACFATAGHTPYTLWALHVWRCALASNAQRDLLGRGGQFSLTVFWLDPCVTCDSFLLASGCHLSRSTLMRRRSIKLANCLSAKFATHLTAVFIPRYHIRTLVMATFLRFISTSSHDKACDCPFQSCIVAAARLPS